MRTGAIIAAAGKHTKMDVFRPMLKLNGSTMIQKEIDTLRRAGISPIVVVTGYQAEDLERHLAHRGVVCLRNVNYAETQMLDSIKIGVEYLQERCDHILFLPVDAPLFSVQSLERVMQEPDSVVIPYHNGRSGHPIRLSKDTFSYILKYQGERGLRGAIDSIGIPICKVEVSDPGIWMEVHDDETYNHILAFEKQTIESNEMDYRLKIVLGKSDHFFGPGTARFLRLIDSKGSMLAACKSMGMSYSKGWKMVKEAEDSLGFSFLERKAGGANGGASHLTLKGRYFLICYEKMCAEVESATYDAFQGYFGDQGKFSRMDEEEIEKEIEEDMEKECE